MARDTYSIVSHLIKDFALFLDEFLRDPPFSRPEQLENHLQTIRLRRQLGTASDAIASDEFLASLYSTLQAWGIGKRGSDLVHIEQFADAIRMKETEIALLEGISFDERTTKVADLADQLWNIISNLGIVTNNATVVSGTKALHHIHPDLVVPVDRAYTQKFFGWQNQDFQYGQAKCFRTSFTSFVRIARAVELAKYRDDGWCSSNTKIIDNAIVGFVTHKKQHGV